jgi:hypothetical protein
LTMAASLPSDEEATTATAAEKGGRVLEIPRVPLPQCPSSLLRHREEAL